MEKSVVITIIIALVGVVTLVIGLVLFDLTLSAIGGLIIILPFLVLKLKEYETKKKSVIYYMEDETESLLTSSRTPLKKKKVVRIKTIMAIFIAIITIGFASILMKSYVFEEPTYIVMGAVNEGCAQLNIGGCRKDPSQVIVKFDVNKDGEVGGPGDTLSALLEITSNCTGECVKRRCGCPRA